MIEGKYLIGLKIETTDLATASIGNGACVGTCNCVQPDGCVASTTDYILSEI